MPVRLEAFYEFRVGGIRRRDFIHHYNVQAPKRCLVLPKRLANDALDAISPDGLLAVFFRYGKPETGAVQIVAAAKYRKPVVTATLGTREYVIKRRSIL